MAKRSLPAPLRFARNALAGTLLVVSAPLILIAGLVYVLAAMGEDAIDHLRRVPR